MRARMHTDSFSIKVNDIDFCEIEDVLEHISFYDKSVILIGYDSKGNEYSAIGYWSCGEIVEIEEDTIELEHKMEKE
tara:strand:- start:936 stop:1166 length:231 start_codon:yes stop_codon:yes gene_type:complete